MMEILLFIVFALGFLLAMKQGMVMQEWAKASFHLMLCLMLVVAYIAMKLKEGGFIQ